MKVMSDFFNTKLKVPLNIDLINLEYYFPNEHPKPSKYAFVAPY